MPPLAEAIRRGHVQAVCDALERVPLAPAGAPYRDCARSPVEEAAHLHELGRWQWRAARFAACERNLTRAAALREDVLGGDHPDTLDTMERIAALHHYLRRDDATRRFDAVMRRRARDSLAGGVTLRNWSACLRDRHAAGWFDEACAILERHGGSEHPDYVDALKARAYAEYLRDAKGLRALDFAERAVDAAARCHVDDHPFVAGASLTAARCETKLRRGARARRRLVEVLRIFRAAYGETHPLYALALRADAEAIALEDRATALELHDTADAIYRLTYSWGLRPL